MTILALSTLCTNLANDATSDAFAFKSERLTGWMKNIQIFGTFGGATVTLKASLDGGTTYTAISGGAFTAETFQTLQLKDCLLKAAVSGGDGTTAITIYIA